MRIIIPEGHPSIVLVQTSATEYVAMNATDATHFTPEQEKEWKDENPNYASTEVAGKYFLLKIEECIQQDADFDHPDFKQWMLDIMLKAADFWHEQYALKNN